MLAPVAQTGLPRRLADAIAHSARPGKGEDARKAAEQLVAARDAGDPGRARRAAIKAKLAAPRSAWVREQLGLLAFDLNELASEVAAARCSKPRRTRRLPSEQDDGCDEHKRCQGRGD